MIRKIDAPDDQIGSGVNVSGPLQIGNDWPGTFFRGDHSGSRADFLRRIADRIDRGETHPAYTKYLRDLADEFSACIVNN